MNQVKETPMHVIIVAAGSGTRMGGPVPKQFLPLWGLPVLMHTILAFSRWNRHVPLVVVLPAGEIAFWKSLCSKHQFSSPHQIVAGGSSRFESVKNALNTLSGTGLVGIHDGVRPLISSRTIDRCFSEAARYQSAIPVIEETDSVRQLAGERSVVLDRTTLRCIQTPQVFDLQMLQKAYQQSGHATFTDDASVFEAAGVPVYLTEGDRSNIKITSPLDLRLAEAIMSDRTPETEVEDVPMDLE